MPGSEAAQAPMTNPEVAKAPYSPMRARRRTRSGVFVAVGTAVGVLAVSEETGPVAARPFLFLTRT
ncbi:hypothetical protein GALLR39Z86_23630 [Glycomyces algeriensis]|uniref:Uncharacterized protein n=1 Tax=Glycomyces algeriensis TaxID=256037 RepID=A0A9W6G935_9ACTN|nr:hypothetical protein GALLR39Z86_23630 [Glycomyces algeriensis]